MTNQAVVHQSTAPKKAERLAWPDAARGLSILGVVLLHACLAVPNAMDTLPAQYNQMLSPLRLPLFFLVSGFFSVKVLQYSFKQLFMRRLWIFLVPYVIWVPVEQWLKCLEFAKFHDQPMPDFWFYWEVTIGGRNMYWFLYCLVLCNLGLWLTRRLQPWAAVAISFVPLTLLVASEWEPIVVNVMVFMPIFFIGAHGRALIAWFADRVMFLWGLALAAVSYAAGYVLETLWILRLEYPVEGWHLPGDILLVSDDIDVLVKLTVRLLMLPSAVALVVILSRVPGINGMLEFFGRHTLVLYLGHPIALTLLFNFTYRYEDFAFVEDTGNFWDSPTAWIGVCIIIAFFGGLVFEVLRRIPVIKWTIAAPPLAGILAKLSRNQKAEVTNSYKKSFATSKK